VLPVAVTVVLVLGLMGAEYRESQAGKWLFKPLASAGFLWAAVEAGAAHHLVGQIMLVGFALGWLGDVLLIPHDKRAFLAGLVAFLLGHVAFVAAFVVRGLDPALTGGVLLPLALVAAVVLKWLWPSLGRMRGPVVAYVAVICAMVATAVGTALGVSASVGRPPSGLLLVGALLFFVSDLAVARNRFVLPGFVNRAWGLPAYYGGQLLLALGSGPVVDWTNGGF
jgi:uncharacterized membrane protein YhhN